ncbi:hypothetical protein TIFTF001_031704 [Ficus carica]|uniref:Uncharacterized protein n=1 Tax=Ficus carica TaxID=3494 RepID=A0AA88J4L8_FICCA|nr:hypothetical protein TIFTF001_031704 [Ficus carica]
MTYRHRRRSLAMPEKRFVCNELRWSFDLLRTKHGAPPVRHLHKSPRNCDVLTSTRHLLHNLSELRAPHILSPTIPSIFVNDARGERERERERGGRRRENEEGIDKIEEWERKNIKDKKRKFNMF